MTRNSKHTKNFSIDPERYKKVLDIFDQWYKQELNHSAEICKAIKFYQADKERGSKIEQYIEPFELLKLPPISQDLKDEDIEVIAGSMPRADFSRICEIMEINLNKMLDAKRSPAIRYKKPEKV